MPQHLAVHNETFDELNARRLEGESWDAAIRRWTGLPVRESRLPKAKPKPPAKPVGHPWAKYGYVNEGIRALAPGQWVKFPWEGIRDSTGAYPTQTSLMNAVSRVIATIQKETGAEFVKRDIGDNYQIYRRDPSLWPKPKDPLAKPDTL